MWTPNKFYSQNFEDLYLYRLFSGVDKGFYIDIGAADHCLHSVTACFYVQGWRGINVEPVAESYTSLCEYRSEDTNLNVAVAASSDSVVEIAVYGDSPGNAGHHRVYTGNPIETPVSYSNGDQAETRVVDATTLRKIFDRYVGNQTVNFLKIDIEGKEFDALRGLELQTLPQHQRPQVILLEVTIPFTRLDAPHRIDCRLLLEKNNYKHLYFDGLNDYFCDSSLLERFKPMMLPPNIFDKPSFLPNQSFGQLFIDRDIHANQIEAFENQINQLDNNAKYLGQQIEVKEAQLQEAISDRDSKIQDYAEVQQQLLKLKQQFEEKEIEMNTLLSEVESKSQQNVAAQKKIAELQQQLELKVEELQTVEAEQSARAMEEVEAQKANKEFEQQLEQTSELLTKSQLEAKASSEKAELTLLKLHQIQKELLKVKAQCDTLSTDKMEAQKANKELEQQLEQTSELLTKSQLEAKASSEKAELTLLKLHQIQEELLKVKAQCDTLSTDKMEAQKANKELEQQLEQTSDLLTKSQSEAMASSEKAELTLLQLHQVQEELEHYFFRFSSNDDLLKKHYSQQIRMQKLISDMLNHE